MTLDAKQKTWQNDLIDMSRRNRLLYFSTGMRVTDVQFDPAGRPFDTFLTRLKTARQSLVIAPEDTTEPDLCDVRLAKLRNKARDALNDRGIHILYLAFGLLEWRESESSDEYIYSPLVLLPVTLSRDGLLGAFRLARTPDSECEINPVLLEKLRHDFDITLPSLDEISAELAPQPASGTPLTDEQARLLRALGLFRTAIASKKPLTDGWRLINEVHLSTFSFQKLVMYQDLQRHTAEIRQHGVLRALGGESGTITQPSGLISAGDLDHRVRPQDMLEILDADSSQQEAIVAAKAGASFVLQGPPGTGKSQTIANIIAESLGLGRSVLFVSEKMAALEVVQERLSKAGLGEFCLDLHSNKTDKKTVLNQLRAARNDAQTSGRGPATGDNWQVQSDSLQQTRDKLNTYVRELHLQRLPLGKSVFDAYAELARLHDVPDLDFALANVDQCNQSSIAHTKEALAQLAAYRDVLDQRKTYPWHETSVTAYTHELEGDIRAHFGRIIAALEQLDTTSESIRAILDEATSVPTFGWFDTVLARADLLAKTPQPPQNWLQPDTLRRLRLQILPLAEQGDRYQSIRADLDTRYHRSILQLDHAALLDTLTAQSAWAMRCLRFAAESSYDGTIAHRDDMQRRIADLLAIVRALREQASPLADMLQLAPPPTPNAVADMVDTASIVLDTPAPPKDWLDNDRFNAVRVIALEACERYPASQRRRADLEEHYDSSFFDLDIQSLAQRQREKWTSVLRYLQPGYYGDLKQMRACLKLG